MSVQNYFKPAVDQQKEKPSHHNRSRTRRYHTKTMFTTDRKPSKHLSTRLAPSLSIGYNLLSFRHLISVCVCDMQKSFGSVAELGLMHRSWKPARVHPLREFESHRFRHFSYRKPSIFNELMGFLLSIFSLVPALAPIYSSKRSLTNGMLSSLSLGSEVDVVRCLCSSYDAASNSLTRCSSCSLTSASLDAWITAPSLIRRSN